MRVMVFFDLPVETAAQRREYTRFRKFLIKSGYLMMQESVYCKICLNNSGVESVQLALEKRKPKHGLVQVLVITERQFSKITYLVGQRISDVLDSDARLVIL
jgi:CRISPR-associated protein Cas2